MTGAPGPARASFLLCCLCLLDYAGLFPRFSGGLMAIQFLVIHSSAFVATLPYWNIGEKYKPAVFKWLLALYTLFAFSMGGLFGIAEFWGLTYAAYHRYVFQPAAAGGRLPLALRWAVSFVLFILATGLAGAPSDVDSWGGSRALGLAGFLYFLAAGWLERIGFYDEGWRRLVRRALERWPRLQDGLSSSVRKEIYGDPGKPDAGGDRP